MYDVGNSRACAGIWRRTLVVMIYDAYKYGYQSMRAFALLIDFPQMRSHWRYPSSREKSNLEDRACLSGKEDMCASGKCM